MKFKNHFKENSYIIKMNAASILFLHVDPSSDLYALYKERADKHNQVNQFRDAGFDLIVPTDTEFVANHSKKIDFGVTCAMFGRYNEPLSFYMYARSSISKTNFRLSNNVGIIDSGYRGTIGAYFDAYPWQDDTFVMQKGTRVVQLCSPTLEPFFVQVVDCIESLGQTERGTGGFGSTGL
jgi:dUTP pyrophosphatase